MYGCIYIGGYDEKYCTLENSEGWGWVAAWYFIVFVIVGVMVLVALFIGVIITSMELLHNSIEEESVMLKKVGLKQAEYQMSDGQIATLLEVFEMVDLCLNAKLTVCAMYKHTCICIYIYTLDHLTNFEMRDVCFVGFVFVPCRSTS